MAIVWLRQDLRLRDNPALYYASKQDSPVIPVYIYDESLSSLGGASRWWLHHSLAALEEGFKQKNTNLLILHGNTLEILLNLAKKYQVKSIFWNLSYDPNIIAHDLKIATELNAIGVETKSFNGNLLYDPNLIKNKLGAPYKIFSQFWKACQKNEPQRKIILPIPKLQGLPFQSNKQLNRLRLLPKKSNWTQGLGETFKPGEIHALRRLKQFVKYQINQYAELRDFPAERATSLLSPHLHFGELTPLQIYKEIQLSGSLSIVSTEKFMLEIGWREFAAYMLYHFQNIAVENLNPKFNNFHWEINGKMLKSWRQGMTGYPIVDAGMRELWQTGFMHNRVRMIVASFLTKDLLIHWKEGAEWFMDTLVDADIASNSLNWQWVAGSGIDASPFFRIFNPISQSEKFDPEAKYIRQWIPEISRLPNQFIHKPWEAPADTLKMAQITLGKDYPYPIVNHEMQRKEALMRYRSCKDSVKQFL